MTILNMSNNNGEKGVLYIKQVKSFLRSEFEAIFLVLNTSTITACFVNMDIYCESSLTKA